jgi:hypothetical protein
MKPFCEIFVKNFLPTIRALLAKNLIEKHNLTQTLAAEKLCTTQPAISHYKREVRGKKAKMIEKDEEVSKKISELAEKLISGIDIVQATKEICEICKLIRQKKIACEFCELREENCDLCLR